MQKSTVQDKDIKYIIKEYPLQFLQIFVSVNDCRIKTIGRWYHKEVTFNDYDNYYVS